MTERPTHRGALPPGTRVQEFEFLQVLGHGGFGITYKGWNATLEKTVAIKEYMPADAAVRESDRTVQPKSDDDEEDFQWGLERFLDEARMLARFEGHPGIVQVQQFFKAHGTAYIVMEYLDGHTLGALYEEHKVLTEQQLRTLLGPLFEALEQVHETGLLHRDIKPSNIALRQDGTPVLIDFGAARAAIATRSQSMTAIVAPGFSPIEQYSTSDESRQGPWTDIYALGAVLYQGMTGLVPNDSTARTMDDRLTPVGEAAAGHYSKSLIDAVNWALRMRGSDRPQSIGEWREVLDGGEPVPTPSENRSSGATAETSAKTQIKNRLSNKSKWLSGMVLAVVLAVGGAAYWRDELPELNALFLEASGFIEKFLDWAMNDTAEAEAERDRLMAQFDTHLGEDRVLEASDVLTKLENLELVDEEKLASMMSELQEARAAKIETLVAECDRARTGTDLPVLQAVLGCYGEILLLDDEHETALEKINYFEYIIDYKETLTKDTVDGYFNFAQKYKDENKSLMSSVHDRLRKKEDEYWEWIDGSNDAEKFRLYIELFNPGKYRTEAEEQHVALDGE